jgi:hypothetical protein
MTYPLYIVGGVLEWGAFDPFEGALTELRGLEGLARHKSLKINERTPKVGTTTAGAALRVGPRFWVAVVPAVAV